MNILPPVVVPWGALGNAELPIDPPQRPRFLTRTMFPSRARHNRTVPSQVDNPSSSPIRPHQGTNPGTGGSPPRAPQLLTVALCPNGGRSLRCVLVPTGAAVDRECLALCNRPVGGPDSSPRVAALGSSAFVSAPAGECFHSRTVRSRRAWGCRLLYRRRYLINTFSLTVPPIRLIFERAGYGTVILSAILPVVSCARLPTSEDQRQDRKDPRETWS